MVRNKALFLLIIVFVLMAFFKPSSGFALGSVSKQFTYEGYIEHSGAAFNGTSDITVEILTPGSSDSSNYCRIYSETHVGVLVVNGFFSIRVGSVTPLSHSIFENTGANYSASPYNGAAIGAGSCAVASASGDSRKMRITLDPTSPNLSPETLTTLQIINSVPSALVAESVGGVRPGGMMLRWTTPGRPDCSLSITNGIMGFNETLKEFEVCVSPSWTTINISADSIEDGAVTTAKIADGNVTLAKLATDSVNSDKITDASIAAADIATNAITTAKINADAVTSGKIADGTILDIDVSATAGIKPYKLDSAGAGVNQVLMWSSTGWIPGDAMTSLGSAGGNVNGTWSNLHVVKIQGHAVQSISTPTSGHVLKWNAGAWHSMVDDDTPSGAATGDLTGEYPSPFVQKIHGFSVLSLNPNSQDVLMWHSGNSRWEPQPLPGVLDSQYIRNTGGTLNGSLVVAGTSNTTHLEVFAFSTQSQPLVRMHNSTMSVLSIDNQGEFWKGSYRYLRNSSTSDIGVGVHSLDSITTPSGFNTAVGLRSGFAITSGSVNTIIGANSGRNISTGFGNTTLGFRAGDGLSTGYENVLIGLDAGRSITTQTGNIAIGSYSQSMSSGNGNLSVGHFSMSRYSGGTNNIGVGVQALYGNGGGGGSQNIGIGYQTLYENSGGAFNIAMGYRAGGFTTTGSHNILIGRDAGYGISSGTNNILIGNSALGNSTMTNKLMISNVSSNTLLYGDFEQKYLRVSGTLEMEGNYVTGVRDPANSSDAATKYYADNMLMGRMVQNVTPTNDHVLKWSAGDNKWIAAPMSGGGAPTGPATGDLGGTYPSPTVNRIAGMSVSASVPQTTGQVLRWNGSAWEGFDVATAMEISNGQKYVNVDGDVMSGYLHVQNSMRVDGYMLVQNSMLVNSPLYVDGDIILDLWNIRGLAAGIASNDAANVGQLANTVANESRFVEKDGDVMSGHLDMNSYSVIGLPAAPIASNAAVSKIYVDSKIMGLSAYTSTSGTLRNGDVMVWSHANARWENFDLGTELGNYIWAGTAGGSAAGTISFNNSTLAINATSPTAITKISGSLSVDNPSAISKFSGSVVLSATPTAPSTVFYVEDPDAISRFEGYIHVNKVRMYDGSLGNPSFGFEADTDTGFARLANDRLSIVAGANESIVVHSTSVQTNTLWSSTLRSIMMTSTTVDSANINSGSLYSYQITSTTIGAMVVSASTLSSAILNSSTLNTQVLLLNSFMGMRRTSDDVYVGESPYDGNDTTNERLTGIGVGVFYNSGTVVDSTAIGHNSQRYVDVGYRNTSVGTSALYNMQNASDNTVVGYRAMYSNTGSGSYNGNNVAIGSYAMYSNTNGYDNVAIGKYTLSDGMFGYKNVVIGTTAGQNATGNSNVIIGDSAARDISSNETVSIGARSSFNMLNGTMNTAIGYEAGYSFSSASGNTVVGYRSAMNSSGTRATAVGVYTLKNISGLDNTSMGYMSMASGTGTAFENTAVGSFSLEKITNGAQNTSVGVNSGANLTSGTLNSFFGKDAGMFVTAGQKSTYIGAESGNRSVSGAHNTAVGFRAFYASTTNTGDYNTAVGSETLAGNGSRVDNTAVGYRALYALGTGSQNTAVGVGSGDALTDGSNNVFMGVASGGSLTSGSRNVMIGANSGTMNGAGSDNIFIGYGAGGNENGSNKLYIANSNSSSLIYGEFPNNFLKITASSMTVQGRLNVNTVCPGGMTVVGIPQQPGAVRQFCIETTERLFNASTGNMKEPVLACALAGRQVCSLGQMMLACRYTTAGSLPDFQEDAEMTSEAVNLSGSTASGAHTFQCDTNQGDGTINPTVGTVQISGGPSSLPYRCCSD